MNPKPAEALREISQAKRDIAWVKRRCPWLAQSFRVAVLRMPISSDGEAGR